MSPKTPVGSQEHLSRGALVDEPKNPSGFPGAKQLQQKPKGIHLEMNSGGSNCVTLQLVIRQGQPSMPSKWALK